ncbi:MAG: GNAT family N-acetyltransferase, partial [Nocardioides sp.]
MSRSAVTLRPARPTDAPVLAKLWADVLQRGHEDEHEAHCQRIIARTEYDSSERIVVAVYDGEVAGAVHLRSTTVSPLNLEP